LPHAVLEVEVPLDALVLDALVAAGAPDDVVTEAAARAAVDLCLDVAASRQQMSPVAVAGAAFRVIERLLAPLS
jgi:hypothetical protein